MISRLLQGWTLEFPAFIFFLSLHSLLSAAILLSINTLFKNILHIRNMFKQHYVVTRFKSCSLLNFSSLPLSRIRLFMLLVRVRVRFKTYVSQWGVKLGNDVGNPLRIGHHTYVSYIGMELMYGTKICMFDTHVPYVSSVSYVGSVCTLCIFCVLCMYLMYVSCVCTSCTLCMYVMYVPYVFMLFILCMYLM